MRHPEVPIFRVAKGVTPVPLSASLDFFFSVLYFAGVIHLSPPSALKIAQVVELVDTHV